MSEEGSESTIKRESSWPGHWTQGDHKGARKHRPVRPRGTQCLLPVTGTPPPTSFTFGLPPCRALQPQAMATGPKRLDKSLREPHAGCHSRNLKPRAWALRRSEKRQKEKVLIPQKGEA